MRVHVYVCVWTLDKMIKDARTCKMNSSNLFIPFEANHSTSAHCRHSLLVRWQHGLKGRGRAETQQRQEYLHVRTYVYVCVVYIRIYYII